MNAYVVVHPGKTEFMQVDQPHPGPYEALVQIDLCVICNTTDRMIINGTFPYPIRYPSVLGHESVGTVIQIGDKVTSYKVGNRVTRAGFRPDHSDNAIHSAWGGFSSYGIAEDIAAKRTDGLPHGYIKQSPQVIPGDIPLRDAALMVSLGETSSFTKQLGDLKGKHVVVVGTGIAGYAITFFAKHFGAETVTTIGRRRERLALAEKLGADRTVNIAEESIPDKLLLGTADIVVEASGNEQAFLNSLRYLKNNGRICIYGVAEGSYEFPLRDGPMQFQIEQIHPDETETMPYLINLSRKQQLPTPLLLTHEWKFSELDTAFRQVDSGEVVKGIVWLKNY